MGKDRVDLAKQVITDANPLWFGDECLRWFYVTEDEDKADHNTLTNDEVCEVREALVVRIKERAESGQPMFDIEVSQESSLLFEWWRAEGREPVQKHLRAVFERDPSSIALFLQSMAPRAMGGGDVVPRTGDLEGSQLKNIELIFDLEELAALIRQHLPGDFENPQWIPGNDVAIGQRLAEQFMFVFKKWKSEKEATDSPTKPPGDDEEEKGESKNGDSDAEGEEQRRQTKP